MILKSTFVSFQVNTVDVVVEVVYDPPIHVEKSPQVKLAINSKEPFSIFKSAYTSWNTEATDET